MVSTFCVWRGLYGFAINGPKEMPEYFAGEKKLVTSYQDNKRLELES